MFGKNYILWFIYFISICLFLTFSLYVNLAKADNFEKFSILRLLSPSNNNITIPKPLPKPNITNTVVNNFEFQNIFTTTPYKKPIISQKNIYLSNSDIEIYQQIFNLQRDSLWQEADKKINKLNDMRLLGYILYQRYIHPNYNSSETELRDWLDLYSDFAVAKKIYKLANRKFKNNFPKPKKQKTLSHRVVFSDGHSTKPYKSKKYRNNTTNKAILALKRQIASDLSKDAPTKALKKLQESKYTKYMDRTEINIIKADIAAAYFYLSLFDKAKNLALSAANESTVNVPLAGWIAGLIYWTEADYTNAAIFFEKSATSKRASEWMRSASAYWAARSYIRAKKSRKAVYWLKQASMYPRSFYGLIAMSSLGIKKHNYDWSKPNGKDNDYATKIINNPNGYRALLLLKVGQQNLAMEELTRINLRNTDIALKEAVFMIASKYNIPNISMQLASTVHRPNGKLYDVALYPISPWRPDGGFELSPALIHAFIRQESKFNPYAKSRSGAKGLMQIMPKTASYIAGKPSSYFKTDEGIKKLSNPVLNITLGQKYLKKLLSHPAIDGNILQLIAAYNAGPGRLSRWKRKINIEDDPLLFIEMLPAAETRAFVEKVMANYWIYHLRLYGKTPASLQSIASGKWPVYEQDARLELARKSPFKYNQ